MELAQVIPTSIFPHANMFDVKKIVGGHWTVALGNLQAGGGVLIHLQCSQAGNVTDSREDGFL